MQTSDTLQRAQSIADRNPVKGLPRMAATLTGGGHFFWGMNSRKSHPLQKRFSKHSEALCLHAEIAAIHMARKLLRSDDLSSFVLSVARVKKDGTSGLAQPCSGCMRAIKHFKIKRVEWT